MKDKNLFRSLKGAEDGFINFTSNDYLGMSRRPEVIEAGVKAALKYGAGATASRLAGGNHALYEELEASLAANKGTEAALVFGSGYLTNIGVISALEPDVVFADKLVHACIIDGVKLSGAKLIRFKHNDMGDLRKRLEENCHPRARHEDLGLQPPQLDSRVKPENDRVRKLIITEEIFSMDGDTAPIDELTQFNTPLLIDGAHSLYQSPITNRQSSIYVGTLSKAIGCYGGYVAGSKTLIEFLKNKARTFVYSTGLPPFVIGSAIKSLEIIEKEKPYLKALENVKYLSSKFQVPSSSAIIPIILGSEEKAIAAEQLLKQNKILVSAIRPPTVPKGTSRLRISVTAAHTKEEIDLLANCLKTIL